jgi:hypothetical protein
LQKQEREEGNQAETREGLSDCVVQTGPPFRPTPGSILPYRAAPRYSLKEPQPGSHSPLMGF